MKLHGKFNELPVSNITLLTAIGKKSTTIKKQVACTICIDGKHFDINLLIVPRLSNMIIIGSDWLGDNRVIINYEVNKISIDGICVSKQAATFGKRPTENSQRKLDADDVTYIQTIDCDVNGDINLFDYSENDIKSNYFTSEFDKQIANQVEESNFLDFPKINIISGNLIRENEFDATVKDNIRILNGIENIGNEIDSSINNNTFLRDLEDVINDLSNLDEVEKREFFRVMSQFGKLFSQKSCSANVEPYRLKIKKHDTIVRKTYPVPFIHREKTDITMLEMLKRNIIEPSTSKHCNPIRIVLKNNGTVRVCLDARYVNNIIESDHESPPLICELLQKFHGTNLMSLTDLESGYWQIPLHPESRKYTAFLYNSRMYQFYRVPFGLKTAGSAFIRSIAMALGDDF